MELNTVINTPDTPQVLTINGTRYLGRIVENEGGLEAKDAMVLGAGTLADSLKLYLIKGVTGELTAIEFGGNATSFTRTALTDDQADFYAGEKLAMGRAARKALPQALVYTYMKPTNIG